MHGLPIKWLCLLSFCHGDFTLKPEKKIMLVKEKNQRKKDQSLSHSYKLSKFVF